MVEKNNSEKKCFVICPIGEEDSVVRKRSDLVLEYVIKLVTNDLGYVPMVLHGTDATPPTATGFPRETASRIDMETPPSK